MTPRLFTNRGVKLLVLDLDNTLSPYGEDRAAARLLDWVTQMKRAGLELFILSNNRGDRPALFAKQLGIGFSGHARKPFSKSLKALLADKGLAPSEVALIGDQIYTDVLCAVNTGVLSVLVRPIALSNPLLALRYGLEAPFRGVYRWKRKK